jgi:DNA helicase HerA-like ATPase
MTRPDRDVGDSDNWSRERIVTSGMASAIIRSPDRELPGIRVVDALDFDITPESSGPIAVGSILDSTRQPCIPLSLATESINRHVFVTGATGSGKSETVRSLADQLAEHGIPWLVIEPAKSEYARLAGRIRRHGANLSVIRPGRPDVAPASLNPLEPTSIVLNDRGRVFFNLQTHLDLVRALFTAAFDAEEPFPQILAQGLTRSYEELGWNLALGRPIDGDPEIRPRFPNLADLQRAALAAVDSVNYGNEVRDNVRGFVDVRIGSLRLGTTAQFFESGHPLDLERLLGTNVVFEIEDIGDDNDKAFFIGTVLIRLYELLRLYEVHGRRVEGLRHVTIIEEAHRLLRNVPEESPAAHAVTMFANLLAEVRAYGEGIVVAEQIPAKIIPDVVKNSSVKILHRLPAADDRSFVGSTMNLTERQSQVVVSLSPGQAAVHTDGMDHPILASVDTHGRESEEIDEQTTEPLFRSRSHTCPRRCKDAPCTVEVLVMAGVLAEKPAFTLWAEISLLSRVMGEPAGSLTQSFRRFLADQDSLSIRCAIGLAATAAVARRYRWIRLSYDPRLLEGEIVSAMVSQFRDGQMSDAPDLKWRIGRFKWADVRRSLDAETSAVKAGTGPFPVPAEWKARGLEVEGMTWEEVRRRVTELDAALETPFSPTFLGVPNAIDSAAALLSSQQSRGARLDMALESVLELPSRWPSYRLYPANESVEVS